MDPGSSLTPALYEPTPSASMTVNSVQGRDVSAELVRIMRWKVLGVPCRTQTWKRCAFGEWLHTCKLRLSGALNIFPVSRDAQEQKKCLMNATFFVFGLFRLTEGHRGSASINAVIFTARWDLANKPSILERIPITTS